MKESISVPLTAAAYIRVSTDDQLEYSPGSQLEEIKAYASKNNISLPEKYIYIEEEGRSGRKTDNRIAFQKMIHDAKHTPKPFDMILLWKFSRFARNQDESTFYKSMLRKKLNIDVISVSEPIMDGMYGRLVEMIIEWQDEFYSINLSAEVTRSMVSRAKKGLYNSGVPIGYHKLPGQVPTVIESQAAIVRIIFHMFADDIPPASIARHLNSRGFYTKRGNRWSSCSIRYVLENPFYIGRVRWNRRRSSRKTALEEPENWIVADSLHQPIIERALWETVQAKIASHTAVSNTAPNMQSPHSHNTVDAFHKPHWLCGIVKCAVCGRFLSYKSGGPGNRKTHGSSAGFQCPGYSKGIHAGSQYICVSKLEQLVIEALRKSDLYSASPISITPSMLPDKDITSQTDLLPADRALQSALSTLYTRQIKALKNEALRLQDAYLKTVITLEEYAAKKAQLDRQHNLLYTELNALEGIKAHQDFPEAQKVALKHTSFAYTLPELLQQNIPTHIKAKQLQNAVSHITFHKNTGEIELHDADNRLSLSPSRRC